MQERQPVLHARVTAALAYRRVEHVVGRRRAKGLDVAAPEATDGLARELEFGYRHEIERVQLIGSALRLRVESADGLERVAKEVEPHRLAHARREQVDDAAAHRIVARLAHGRGARKAIELEPAGDAGHV